mmetsp:Transcript_64312/g.153376  ORF Transcript_64312/g.153376 Transcript_64312/m.153376 type:complete len:231 (+) Transcript_64312:696-1388(+)
MSRGHLANDTPNAPYIYGDAVDSRAEQDLRCTIPHCYHLVSVLWNRDSVCTRQSKVSDLQDALGIDKQVLGLEIPVKDATGMTEVQPLQELVGQLHYLWRCQGQVLALHVLLQVVLHKLKDQGQLVCGAEDIQQLHHILMAELLQKCNLSNGCAWNTFLLSIKLHLLHRHWLASATAESLEHFAVGTFAKRCHLVDVIPAFKVALCLGKGLISVLAHGLVCKSCFPHQSM